MNIENITGKVKAALATASFDPMFAVKLFDRFITWSRTIVTADLFNGISAWFVKLGHVMLVGMAALSFAFWTILAIKQSNGIFLLYGLGCALLFPVLQYTAHKFLNAGQLMISVSPSRLSSGAFMDCLALLASVLGLMLFITSLLYREWSAFFSGLGLWITCDLIAFVALNPALASTVIARDASPGEEAIGIISFFAKAFMRIVPMVFGAGVTLFFLALLNGTIILFSRRASEFDGETALRNAVYCACLPIASYVIFAIYHLTIDILRAVLVIPVKLDQLRDKKDKSGELEKQ